MKKSISILLALVLLLSLSVTAFATEPTAAPTKNDSITVNSVKAGETYDLYKLFDLVVDSETTPAAYSYTVNSDWASFFKAAEGGNPAGPGNQYITVNTAGYVTEISDVAALAAAAAAWTGKPASPVQTQLASGETVVFSNLEDGYWLITSTLGTVAMTDTTPDANAVTIEEKNPVDTVEKKVQEDSNSSFGETNDAQIGDTMQFETVVTLVKGTRNVVVHDAMTAGLTYTANSIEIAGLTVGTDYTVNERPEDGDTFDITFTDEYISSLVASSTTVTITYSAVLNQNAVSTGPAIVDQINTASVTYGDSQSVEVTTTTTTHSFKVFKHAKDSTDNLADAVFSLKKGGTVVSLIKLDENNYRVAMPNEAGAVDTFTTVVDGDIVIWGVDSDDYTLLETVAPAGYNKLTAEVEVTVSADNAIRADVENQTGAELPSTGGIGTTLFYVIGGLLVVGATVVLITKKRIED